MTLYTPRRRVRDGNLDTHDGLCRHLAARLRLGGARVDHRLAPEHPYPAAIEDVSRALDRLRGAAQRHELDPQRTAVAATPPVRTWPLSLPGAPGTPAPTWQPRS